MKRDADWQAIKLTSRPPGEPCLIRGAKIHFLSPQLPSVEARRGLQIVDRIWRLGFVPDQAVERFAFAIGALRLVKNGELGFDLAFFEQISCARLEELYRFWVAFTDEPLVTATS